MKEQIEGLLKEALIQEFNHQQFDLPEVISFVVERPKDKSHGDFSSNIAMLNAKYLKIAPRAFAESLLARLLNNPLFEKVEIAGPGFINFMLKQSILDEQIESMWQSPTLGIEPVKEVKTVVVDYSSPNLAKEMHVGHLRSTIIGDAIANVLALKGYHVIRQNHVGDWGTQFGMLLAHFDDEQKSHADTVDLSDLETFYKAAKKRFDEEPDFAQRSRSWVVLLQSGDKHCLDMWHTFIDLSLNHCQEIYHRLGVQLTHDDVRAESSYNDDLPIIVDLLKEKGLLEQHDGAQCVFMPEFKGKNDEPLPVIVQKKDGGFLYASTDLAALRYRYQVLHVDRILYVVDARQSLHFQQVFTLAKLAGLVGEQTLLEHIGFGMVLDKSGRPYKSREGGVTKLADLLDEAERRALELIVAKQTSDAPLEQLKEMAKVIGISSVKYADLSKNRISDYVFDWDSMISFEGNTAPYLLYAYTRINSVFLKAGIEDWHHLQASVELHDAPEIALAKHLVMYSEIINQVALKAAPHFLCTYLYELAVLFSSFYENCPILNQDNEQLRMSRLKLAALTAKVLKQGLGLLGISTLSRM